MGTKKGAGQTAPTMEKTETDRTGKERKHSGRYRCTRVPEITVRIDKLFCDEDKSSRHLPVPISVRLRFTESVCLKTTKDVYQYAVEFLHGCTGQQAVRGCVPSVTKEGRGLLVKNVLDAYKQALEQAQTNSRTHSRRQAAVEPCSRCNPAPCGGAKRFPFSFSTIKKERMR